MAYFGRRSDQKYTAKRKKAYDKNTGGIMTAGSAANRISQDTKNPKDIQFFEIEIAEVMVVYDNPDKLPKYKDGKKIWELMGAIKARCVNSELNQPLDRLKIYLPFVANQTHVPLRGELVVVSSYNSINYYQQVAMHPQSVNANIYPGLSGTRDEDSVKEDFLYDHFEIPDEKFGNDTKIRRLMPHEGDITFEGRFGQSIRFGSAIKDDDKANEGGGTKRPGGEQNTPNIMIRSGQLHSTDIFGKDNVKQSLFDEKLKPVDEDINLDGSSLYLTSGKKGEQKINLDLKPSNSKDHALMNKVHRNKQPKDGGEQIILNSDRITFNSKRNEILGFSALGIGWSTKWSFTIDADKQFALVTPKVRIYAEEEFQMITGASAKKLALGGGHPDTGEVQPFHKSEVLMQDAGASGLQMGETVMLSSHAPSHLKLDMNAHLESEPGAFVHCADCAGMYSDKESYVKVGGKQEDLTAQVSSREDLGEQTLVGGEKITETIEKLMDNLIDLGDKVLSLTGIATGAGPSGPISSGPTNTATIEQWKATVEQTRAEICDCLLKPK